MEPSELAARIVLGQLDDPNMHIGLRLLELEDRKHTLSGGETVLVELAMDFWNGHGGAKVADVLNRLDSENYRHFLEALEVKRGALR